MKKKALCFNYRMKKVTIKKKTILAFFFVFTSFSLCWSQEVTDYEKWELNALRAETVIETDRASIQALEKLRVQLVQWRTSFQQLQNDQINYTSNFMRIWNEGATLILFAVVFLVLLKSTLNMAYGMLGLVGLEPMPNRPIK